MPFWRVRERMMSKKPNRRVWETGSTNRSVAGEFYDKVWDYAEALEAENASLTEKVEGYADALEKIVNWSKAYPLDVFPEPDLKKAHKILKANGMTLDAISASAIRHVVTVTGKMAADALLESE